METAPITSWTLQQEIPIPDDVTPLLVQGEEAVAAFNTFRDSAVFTTKRLIVRDAQGLAGKKVEICDPDDVTDDLIGLLNGHYRVRRALDLPMDRFDEASELVRARFRLRGGDAED